MIQQTVITDWKVEMARMEQHTKVSSALFQKTSHVLNALMVFALRTRRKEFYDRLRVLMTHCYFFIGKNGIDRVSEITCEQASLSLDNVAATENMHTTYTAEDVQELKTLTEEYRATLGKPRKLTVKQQEKTNLALKDLEGWKEYVPGESAPLPPPVVPKPPIDWQAEFAKRQKHSEVKSALLKKSLPLMNGLRSYAMRTRRNKYYEKLRTLDQHTWTLCSKGPFEKACEVMLEQASLNQDAVAATENLFNTYTAADVQEYKTLLEEYLATAGQPLKTTPKQQEKIDKAVKDLEGWKGYVPEEGQPAPVITPPLTFEQMQANLQEKWAKMKKHSEVKSALLKKTLTITSGLRSYAMRMKKNEFYEELSTLDKHTWTLYSKGPFEKVCEVAYEQASLHPDAVAATENLFNTYTAANLQEYKTLLEEYLATAGEPRKATPKQQEKIDKAVKDLEGWKM